ncbi:MAG: AAA family ATPase [Lachnospiraceae bacterium]|jgi:hypothetical protein|nr:AAA family ATPase [Lachnospiraceae bacterium]
MGNYVNPGNVTFRRLVNSDIYVDKTKLISMVNKRLEQIDCFMCVSRPRRFGKSMAANMLAAYYSKGCDSRNLFAGLEAEQEKSFETHLNQHAVIRFDVQHFLDSRKSVETFIGELEKAVVEELIEEFPDCRGIQINTPLKTALDKLWKQTGEGFVFLIDEWDCVFRLAKERQDIQKDYLDFLRGLFKGTEYVELVYMTGILPIKKYGEHSALNIFDEYSMVDSFGVSQYFGFTEEEVQRLCLKQKVSFTGLQEWYDGYLVDGLHIYNPKSVADALRRGEQRSYWTGTETYEALKVYIDLDYDGLKQAIITMLGNGHCKVNTWKFQNDMTTFQTKDDVLTLLVHLGYLTYDKATNEVFIPNQEIAQEFCNAIDGSGWNGVVETLSKSEELLKNTWAMNEKAVAAGIEKIHEEMTSILQYNSENALTCTILLAYYSAKAYYLTPIQELPTGKGFADVVYLPRQRESAKYPALVIELKWNQSAEGAIKQIREKRYASWVEGYTGEILLVGISYDWKEKKHSCVVERHVKKERK